MTNNKQDGPVSGWRLSMRLMMITGGIIVFSLIAHWFEWYMPRLELWILSLGSLAPIVFVVLFAVTTPFFLSVDALCVAAGVLFPLGPGGFYIVIATFVSASVIFVLGRYFFRDRVSRVLESHPKLKRLDGLLGEDGFKVLFLLRLLPLPFALLSYALSVTRVRFVPYIISTSGILLYNLALVYFGYTAKHLTSAGMNLQAENTVDYPLLIVGLFAVLIGLSLVVHRARTMIGKIDPLMVGINHDSDK